MTKTLIYKSLNSMETTKKRADASAQETADKFIAMRDLETYKY